MPIQTPDSTCWSVIRAAAAGSGPDREELARRYLDVVRAYLAVRWRGSALHLDLDDASQEVFVECFRQGGVIEAAASGRVPNFRAFLYGVIRNVARRFESRPIRKTDSLSDIVTDDESQSRLFDRAWAKKIMTEAAGLLQAHAAKRGADAVQRVELLRLRFEENLPIRAIAERWEVSAATLHHAYAIARKEFKAALLEVVAFHQPGSLVELEQEASNLLRAIS